MQSGRIFGTIYMSWYAISEELKIRGGNPAFCKQEPAQGESGDHMKTVNVQITVPEGMRTYLNNVDYEQIFERNAMLLYPFIRNLTISHGRAAEILGVHKTDLIEFYDSMGIPYLNQSEEELMADLATLDRVMGAQK